MREKVHWHAKLLSKIQNIIYYQNIQSIFAEAKQGDKATVVINSKENLEREIVQKSLIIYDVELLSSVTFISNSISQILFSSQL